MKFDFSPYLARIQQEIISILPQDFNQELIKDLFGDLFAVNNDNLSQLKDPCRDLIDLGGKRWRPLLQVLVTEALGGTKEQVESSYKLTPLVEFVHTASLIHDDIEDSSDTRRGKPAAYITYGLDRALNAASWLYFSAPVCIDRLNSQDSAKLYALYAMELRRLHLGQAMDIQWHRDTNFIPSAEQYEQMVRCKTGTLASLAVKTGCICAGKDMEFAQKAADAATLMGKGFQIIDDVTNIAKGNPGKKRGDDIVEGKKSLPVILFAHKCGGNITALKECFEQASKEGIESPAVEKAVNMLLNSKAVEMAAEQGRSDIRNGLAKMQELFGNNDGMEKISSLFEAMAK